VNEKWFILHCHKPCSHYLLDHIVGLRVGGIGEYKTTFVEGGSSKISMWQSRPKHQQNQYQGRSGGQKQWHRYKAVHAHDVGMARAAVDHFTIPNGFLISLAHHIICVAASFCINAYTIGPTSDD
jgi:hypothetical protein